MITSIPTSLYSPVREKCSLWDESTDEYLMLYPLGMVIAAKEDRRLSGGYVEDKIEHTYTKDDFHVINYLNFAARRTKRELKSQPKLGGNKIKDIKNAIAKIDYYLSLGLYKEKLTETRKNLLERLNE